MRSFKLFRSGLFNLTALYILAGSFLAHTTVAQNNLYPVRHGNGFGFIDASGKLLIEARFDSALDFSEGLAPVKIAGLWGFVDRNGELVIDAVYDRVHEFAEGLARK